MLHQGKHVNCQSFFKTDFAKFNYKNFTGRVVGDSQKSYLRNIHDRLSRKAVSFCLFLRLNVIFPLFSDNYTAIHSLQRKRSIDLTPNNASSSQGYNRNNSPLPENQQHYSANENGPPIGLGQNPGRSYVRSNYVSGSSSNRDWRNPKSTSSFSYDNADRYNRGRAGPGQQRDNSTSYGPGRRFISNNRNNNNRFNNKRFNNDHYEESEPEWMDFGPDSMNDFIDLKGFDEGESNADDNIGGDEKGTAKHEKEENSKDISNLGGSEISKFDMSSFLSDNSFPGVLDDSTFSAKSSRFARFFKQASETNETKADTTSPAQNKSRDGLSGDGQSEITQKINIMDMLRNNAIAIGSNVPKLDLSKATTLEDLESMMALPVESTEPKKIVKNELPFLPAEPTNELKNENFIKLLSKLKQPVAKVGEHVEFHEQSKTDQSARLGEKLIETMQQLHSQQQKQAQQQHPQPLPLPPRMNILNAGAGLIPPGVDFPFSMKPMAIPMVGPQPSMMPPNPYIPFYFSQMPPQVGAPGMCPPVAPSLPGIPPYLLNLPLHQSMVPNTCLPIPPGGPQPSLPAMPRIDNCKQQQQQTQQQQKQNNFEQNNIKQRQDHSNMGNNNKSNSSKNIYKNPQFVPTSVFRKMKDDCKSKPKSSLNSVAINNNNILLKDNNRKGKL